MLWKSAASALAAFVMFLSVAAPDRAAAEYPASPVALVVPFPAGGRSDLTARSIAETLERELGVTIAVVNKPGAGGVVGALEVAAAEPDGATLGIFSSAVVSTQYTVETGTDLGDYKVAALVEVSPAAIAVRADSKWTTLSELIEAAKADPGALNLATVSGASSHVFAAGFLSAAGVDMTMVPFKGDAPGVNALVGGHVDAQVAVPASFKSLTDSGQLRILAVAGDERMPQLPDAPTFAEQGVDFSIASFHAIYLPKDASDEIVAMVEMALQRTMQDATVVEQMEGVGLGPLFRNRAEAEAFLQKQDKIYEALITEIGLRRPGPNQ